MSKYIITDEERHYLDVILPTFKLDRIASILTSIKEVCKVENCGKSDDYLFRLYVSIESFLVKYEFGYPPDHVFVVNQKGIDLKNCGSLAAYEEWEKLQAK